MMKIKVTEILRWNENLAIEIYKYEMLKKYTLLPIHQIHSI